MEHELCRENLSAYLDGELPQDGRAGVEAHLAACAACRAELEQLKGVCGLLKKHVMEPVPLSLRKQVLEPRPARPWLKPVLALSTAAAGLLVVINLYKPAETPFSRGPAALGQSFGAASGALSPAESGLDEGREEPAGAAGTAAGGKALSAAPAPAGNAMPAASDAGSAAGAAVYAETEKRDTPPAPAAAATRGALALAKYAAPRNARPLSGAAAGALKPAAAKQPAVRNYRAPVCVHVNTPPIDYEDDPALIKALDFMRKNCAATDQVFPGTLAFTKKDGRTVQLTEQDAPYGIVLFDGVQDPLVVTDFPSLPSAYARYFGK